MIPEAPKESLSTDASVLSSPINIQAAVQSQCTAKWTMTKVDQDQPGHPPPLAPVPRFDCR